MKLGKQIKVVQGSVYEPVQEEKFDIIVSNPPYSAGKTIVNQIIHESVEHLNPGGTLQIVGRKEKGGRMYKEEMLKVFKEVEEVGKKGGFRVYIGRDFTVPKALKVAVEGKTKAAVTG